MDELFGSLGELVQTQQSLAFMLVFAGGLLSAASPCVLAAIPMVIGYVGGYAGSDKRKAALFSFVFVLGLSITFTLLGAAASAMGRVLWFLGSGVPLVLSLICILMGGQLLGFYAIPLPWPTSFTPRRRGLSGAFVLGLISGAFSSPCATPVLAVVLTYVWSKGDILYGTSLLFTYAMAHCALIFSAGLSISWTENLLARRGVTNVAAFSRKASGLVLGALGIYFATTVFV